MDEIRKEETDRKICLIKELDELTGRATGMTTRLVDKYVQELYNHEGEWVEIIDHYDTPISHRQLADKVMERFSHEHPADYKNLSKMLNVRRFPMLKLNKCKIREYVRKRMDSIIEELKNLE